LGGRLFARLSEVALLAALFADDNARRFGLCLFGRGGFSLWTCVAPMTGLAAVLAFVRFRESSCDREMF
jgi:hypothetical protein